MRFGTWNLEFGIWRGAAYLVRCLSHPLLCLLLCASCAPRQVALPSYEDLALEEALAELRGISSVEAVLWVQYEKNDALMSGDAALTLSATSLNLKVFYLGFLAAELIEDHGVISSNPRMDAHKSAMLVEGLRNSLLWWNIRDFSVRDDGLRYVLRNATREVTVDRKTLVPVRQALMLAGGDVLTISYGSPARAETGTPPGHGDLPLAASPEGPAPRPVLGSGLWYPSEMTIGFRDHAAKVRVTSLTILD